MDGWIKWDITRWFLNDKIFFSFSLSPLIMIPLSATQLLILRRLFVRNGSSITLSLLIIKFHEKKIRSLSLLVFLSHSPMVTGYKGTRPILWITAGVRRYLALMLMRGVAELLNKGRLNARARARECAAKGGRSHPLAGLCTALYCSRVTVCWCIIQAQTPPSSRACYRIAVVR